MELKTTRMTLQLADKSITRPHGVVEDVLVKVNKVLFPIDFVAIDMEEDDYAPLFLGRPFVNTAIMMIDVDDGLMKVGVQDEEVCFNIFEAMKHSKDKRDYFLIDTTDEAIMEVKRKGHVFTSLEKALTNAIKVLNEDEEKEIEECLRELEALEEIPPLEAKVENLKEEPKIEESKLELNSLPSHLKYVFLE